MKEQVTSIEQSKRLIELGVPAEMASMVWDTISLASHPILREWDTSTDTKRWQVDRVGHVPAFTVADLLNIIPEGDHVWTLAYYAQFLFERKRLASFLQTGRCFKRGHRIFRR